MIIKTTQPNAAPTTPTTTPSPTERGELADTIRIVAGMLKNIWNESADINAVRPVVVRLFAEGLDKETIIAGLLARKHEVEEAEVLGERSHDRLTIDDLKNLAIRFGLNERNEENQARWKQKFESGRAMYLCPKCGYSGNSEFHRVVFSPKVVVMACFLCPYTATDERFFTRQWTPEEQTAFEEEQAAKSKAWEIERAKKKEDDLVRERLLTIIREDAWKAVREIDRYQTVELDGDCDADDYVFDEESVTSIYENQYKDRLKWVMHLMVLPMTQGFPRMPWDELVTWFKSDLQPHGDGETESNLSSFQFVACANRLEADIRKMLKEGK